MAYTEKMARSIKAHGFTRRNYAFTAMVISKMPPRVREMVAACFVREFQGTPGFDVDRFLRGCREGGRVA